MTKKMTPPARLKRGGRGERRWKALTEAADFDELEIELLAEFCAVLDEIDALPPTAVVERRQQRLVLSRLAGQLALPGEDGSRGRVDGYSVRGRRAALVRWRGSDASA
jgi:hypothetical protein